MTKLLLFGFLSAYLTVLISVESILWKRKNICKYTEEKICYRLKRKVSRSCSHENKNCDNAIFPFLTCRETRCTTIFKRIPQTYTKRRRISECCPGWSAKWNNKISILVHGCLKVTSCITLPQYSPEPCRKDRKEKLIKNGYIYRLTTPPKNVPEKIPEANITADNLLQFYTFPVLNLTSKQVVGLSFANPDERTWAKVYIEMGLRNKAIANETVQPENFKFFTKYSDYAELLDFYRKRQLNGGPSDKYFRYPSQEEDFKDIIKSEIWQKDKVFVEQRLAGLNPISLRKLTSEEYKEKSSHFSEKVDAAIKNATCDSQMDILEMMEQGEVFILDYPLIRDLTNVADILDLNPNDRREMRNSRSPFAIFISVKNALTKKYELKPFAIQTDLKKSAPCYTPSDGAKWMLAKEEVQRADIIHAEIVEHLLKTHLMMEPICVTMQRTLSVFHPLYEILKWHCRGTFVTNSLGLPSLVEPHAYLHNLFAIGHVGSIELLNKAYPNVSWEDANFEENLKKRGVYDSKKLPYYPFRDDGLVIWRLIRTFSKEYVDLYYKNTEFVREDTELQKFANELSAEGSGRNGGMGMLKGFPSKISTKEQVQDVLARIVFIPLHHHAVNYPVAYYGGFVPNMPTKLYDDPRSPAEEFSFYNLPQSHIATIQVSLSISLGSLRFDRLFDYAAQMGDKKAGVIVKKYYDILMGPIQKSLKDRNKERLRDSHLTYPYFLPGWMPNSIHT